MAVGVAHKFRSFLLAGTGVAVLGFEKNEGRSSSDESKSSESSSSEPLITAFLSRTAGTAGDWRRTRGDAGKGDEGGGGVRRKGEAIMGNSRP